MNKDILKTGVQLFINKKINSDIVSVLLKGPVFEGVSPQELAEQIQAKKKSKKKLPTWFGSPKTYFPKKLNIEQASSETTARYKARIIDGKTLLDLTGGFGVDSYFFSKRVEKVFYCEINKNLSEIAAYNFEILGAENIKTISENGLVFLAENTSVFDWIYVDPSRRDAVKGRVFQLADYSPDIPDNLELLFKKADNIMIKTSPLLDFTMGIKELQFVKEIHVVAVNNEVKELLWILNKGFKESIVIRTINLKKPQNEVFDFQFSKESIVPLELGRPLAYVYEPNAALLKSGAFKLVGNRFNLKKLHEHTHLYTSNTLIDFPGRVFKIVKVLQFNKKKMKSLQLKKANITTRNFPMSVAEIRKRFKIKDGGSDYIFFITDSNEKKIILHCQKIVAKA